ncbi:MAG: ABC transporter ATP-binding protein, partial [Anaerolineae bacterium]|nr:ABC transporter ATP-binding protein [Anaerolineae bacterium]
MKPTSVRQTLRRMGGYFKPFWLPLLVVGILLIASTWTQVKVPELIGATVDCYLAPVNLATTGDTPAEALSSLAPSASQTRESRCTLESDPSKLTPSQRLAGLGRMVLLILGLYVFTSVATGFQFYLMTWSGQHVLRNLRVQLFGHMHDLSMSYYTEHEAGDLMSRITNDTEAIGQAINFALLQVVSGILLLLWIAYNMLKLSVPYALLSMVVVPIMLLVTVWLSGQARKAFRAAREDLGNVNAELQESISSVREVQAFSREDENIQNFMVTNAANRDANVKAVSYTAALAPALEALGYAALALVAGI